MSKTSIEWTQHTWNPMAGCSILSPGCINCYAMKMARRIEAMNAALPPSQHQGEHYNGTTRVVNGNAVWTGKIGFSESALLKPLKRKVPTTWFVNSMSDLFHEAVPDEAIDKVFAVMALTPQHTYQALTKRSQRMRRYCSDESRPYKIARALLDMMTAGKLPKHSVSDNTWPVQSEGDIDLPDDVKIGKWPLPNVWLGVSTERQQEADERIPDLLATPAAIRFISAEPLLGPIDLSPKADATYQRLSEWYGPNGFDSTGSQPRRDRVGGYFPRLDWVIVGGESGPDSRPMHPDWPRSVRDQCAAAGVPFFFKQWGSWYPVIDRDNDDPDWRKDYTRASDQPEKFRILNLAGGCGFHGERVHLLQRYSKARAGRLLDGVTYDAMPGVVR